MSQTLLLMYASSVYLMIALCKMLNSCCFVLYVEITLKYVYFLIYIACLCGVYFSLLCHFDLDVSSETSEVLTSLNMTNTQT